jgi:predicted regulator of Ras-like GTPase activity (Roadblock/LC7/MglB family)
MSTEQELTLLVIDMRRSIPELTGVMIASDDGLPVCHDFPDSEADKIAAMAATALGLGKRISERTALGALQETVVRGLDGYLVVYAAGPSAVLVLAGPQNANLGLMRIEARAASAHISDILPS